MKGIKTFLLMVFVCGMVSPVLAIKGKTASGEDVKFLKKDLVAGKIKIGKTRLKQIRDVYGDAATISETDKRVTYDYGDLKIDFDKIKYFRDWEYDYTYGTAYRDEIDDLRFDLEDGQIVGELYTFDQLRKDYDEPTKAFETEEDGLQSIYYYGEIKLVFENYVVVKGWTGKNLKSEEAEGVLGTKK